MQRACISVVVDGDDRLQLEMAMRSHAPIIGLLSVTCILPEAALAANPLTFLTASLG